MKTHHSFAFTALFLSAAIWGITPPIMKLTLSVVPLFSLACIRFGVASLFLFPLVYKHLHIQKKHIPLLIFSGMAGITIHMSLFFWGLTLTSSINASIIGATVPLMTLFLAHTFLREKIKHTVLLGAILGTVGISIILLKDAFAGGVSVSPLGDILLLISTLAFVVYELVSKELFRTYKALPITFYNFVIGTLSFLPAALYEYTLNPQWIATLPHPAWLGILFGIFFPSLLAFSLWQWGLSKVEASRVGFFCYLHPIIGTIAAILILGETPTLVFTIGSLLIFLGLFVAEGLFHFLPFHTHQQLKEAR